jgi:hypothetical protein
MGATPARSVDATHSKKEMPPYLFKSPGNHRSLYPHPRVARFFLAKNIPKRAKYTKNIPNDHKIYKIAIKYSKKGAREYIASGNPALPHQENPVFCGTVSLLPRDENLNYKATTYICTYICTFTQVH